MVRKIWTAMLAMILLVSGTALAVQAEPYPGMQWGDSLQKALMLPQEDSFVIVYNEGERDVMVSGKVPLGDYTADAVMMEFAGEALNKVYYRINKDCSTFAFENLDAYFRRMYGEPICFDPAKINAESFESVYKGLQEMCENDDFEQIWATYNGYFGLTFKSEITDHRVWNIGEHTRLVLSYYEAGLFLLDDYIGVTYISLPEAE